MKIIDFHAHWWPSDRFTHSRQAWKSFIRRLNEMYYKTVNVHVTDEELEDFFFDPEGTKTLGRMDEAGVDKAVLLPLDWAGVNGSPEGDVMEQNEAYCRLAQRYPDRFIPFFSIDPERADAGPLFSKAATEWGMKGLKLYPPTGFYPDDPCCSPLYEVCLDRGLPVVFHGTTSPLSDEPYCHPDGFRRLAGRYPALKIVIAHAGGRDWFTAAAQACLDCEHIYLDISGFQSLLDPELFKSAVEMVHSTLTSFEKVLFGTDSPIFNRMCPIRDMVANLKAADIPEREKANLFCNTGRKILGMI